MKKLSFSLLFLISFALTAQNFENSWTGHFSYVSINSITQGNDKVFCAADNSAFSYDLSTLQLETISTVQGLSGENISTSYYSEAQDLFVIGYENGLIEIVIDGDEDVLTIVDILDKQTIPPDRKRINHFNEYDGILYISAGFGISEYNLETLEFGESFIIGDGGTYINIAQTAIEPPFIYAASPEGGVRRANFNNSNIINFEEWNTLAGGNFKGVQNLSNQIYCLQGSNTVLRFQNGVGFSPVASYSQQVIDFNAYEDLLTITFADRIEAFSEDFILEAQLTSVLDFNYTLLSGLAFDEKFYLGTKEFGLLEVPFNSNQATQYLPDGPILNTPFALASSPGQLWVNFGEVDVNFNPFPLSRRGISNLREGSWTNLPYSEIFDANDLVNISINPEDANEVYMTSFNKGLLKIEDQEAVVLYDDSNSPLESFREDALDIRLYGSDFDRDGNLWFVQSRIEDGLIRLSPSGSFTKFDITDVIAQPGLALSELAISREGTVFFADTESGLVGYRPNGADFNIISDVEGNGNLPSNDIRALAFDANNRLWIGTLEGLRVLFNVGGFFDEDADVEAQAIIIRDDEADVGQELLESQTITDIEVDGSNNKWIATTTGVFYLSPNGQETLLNFTKDNSPLPSNNVQDIAIDDFSGTVYFATLNGLVAFNGTSTAPRDDLESVYAYPNPVRPGFQGNVTIDGLMANANVKITDIEGNLVYEENSRGGSIQWDTTAFGRYKVRSGVYLAIITSDDQLNTAVSKIMIVR
jgi:streptogramin lyase